MEGVPPPMSILSRLGLMFRTQPIENPARPLTGAALLAAFGAVPSASGQYVAPSNALQIASVYACVRVISETISTLPVHVYRRTDSGHELVRDHPAAKLLEQGPNDEMSRVDLFETLVGHVLLWGNGYAEVNRSVVDGSLVSIWPMRPDQTVPSRNSRSALVYQSVADDGTLVRRRADRVLHIRGLSFDGLLGYSPVTLARETLGMAKATEFYGARFFANDSRPGGVLQMDGQLSPDAIERLKVTWEAAHSNTMGNAHRVAVLENGLTWQSIGMPNDDAQWLETRKYTRSEIAGIYRVPAHMINDLDNATFSNIEQQSLDFSKFCITPWCVRIEESLNRTLFTDSERGRFEVKFNLNGLERGDLTSRTQAYATARQNGWMTANEIRALEDMNPIEGGDELLVNGNMVPLDQVDTPPPPAVGPAPAPAALPAPNAQQETPA
jgi:HK97 family phage portal protein